MLDLEALDHAGLFARCPDAALVAPAASDLFHVVDVPGRAIPFAFTRSCAALPGLT